MSIGMARVVLLLAGLVIAGLAGTARAAVVDLDAVTTTAGSPAVLLLPAGTYAATPIDGTYKAWSAWGTTDCVTANTTCGGWLNLFHFSSAELGEIVTGTDLRYPTPEEALADAISAVFTLTSAADVSFYISDSPHSDNRGGISLLVTTVPEPAVPSWVVAVLLPLGVLALRRRDAAAG